MQWLLTLISVDGVQKLQFSHIVLSMGSAYEILALVARLSVKENNIIFAVLKAVGSHFLKYHD